MKNNILESERCLLREANVSDADFILRLINQDVWKKYISDHNINTPDLAIGYINDKLVSMYKQHGFGLWLVELKNADRTPIGLCGLLKRDFLGKIDLGFGFLEDYWGKGLAYETAKCCVEYASNTLKVEEVAAIVLPENQASTTLLDKLGFEYAEEIKYPGESQQLALYQLSLCK